MDRTDEQYHEDTKAFYEAAEKFKQGKTCENAVAFILAYVK